MTLVGQCPSCLADQLLSKENIGRLYQCSCGARLFVCNARDVPTIPLQCKACDTRYELEGEDAGQSAECECGQPLTIPTVVLRQPVQYARELEDLDSGDDKSHRDVADKASGADSATKTRPTPASAPPVRTAPPKNAAIIVETDQNLSRDNPIKAPRRRGIKTSWIAWSVIVATSAFLLLSIVIFVRRDPSVAKAGKRTTPETRPEADHVGSAMESGTRRDGPAIQTLEPAIPSATNMNPPLAVDVGMPSQKLKTVPVHVADRSNMPKSTGEIQYAIPAAPLYALPKPAAARPRIPIRFQPPQRMTLTKAVEEAFEAYESTQQQKQAAEASKSPKDVETYHLSLGTTIGQVIQVLEFAVNQANQEQIHSMRYLLAYLFYDAGHLAEACVMGEAVARWGEKDDPSTREGVMIALAASQEASETHWGNPKQPGELDQMAVLVNLFADRWPDDPQVGDVLMNLGYRYEAFNQPEKAVAVYGRLPESSPQFAGAMIASGLAQWRIARREAIKGDGTVDAELRQRCEQQLTLGLRQLETKQTKPTPQSVEVRLALAQIAMTAGKAKQAENWLIDPKHSVVDAIDVSDAGDSENAVVVNEYTVRQVFDVLYAARRKLGDQAAVKEILDWMARTIPSAEDEMESKYLSTVKSVIDRLKSSSRVTIGQIDELRDLERSMMDLQSSVPTSNLLWLGESWSQIGHQTSDTKAARRCAARAAELYGEAMLRTDFPAGSLQSAQLRTIELLRESGAADQALKMIEEVLARTPNVFALQIAAAESLQQIGTDSGSDEHLRAAVEGPAGFSPIWGWGRLVTSLHAARWSDTGTELHAEQLLRCHFGLAQCRYLLAQASQDLATRKSQLADVKNSLRTLLATMDAQNSWHAKFKELERTVAAAR